jgi:hypothetical protein
MRTLPAILIQVSLAVMLATWPAAAEETATASVSVNVLVSSRTSLKVSSSVALFDVVEPGGAATASIDFTAGARVVSGADVVLTVEPLRQVDGPGGAADVETAITFFRDGDGLERGRLDTTGPTVAGRWHGSGLRSGRLSFTIRAGAAGTYSLPLRFVLSTP